MNGTTKMVSVRIFLLLLRHTNAIAILAISVAIPMAMLWQRTPPTAVTQTTVLVINAMTTQILMKWARTLPANQHVWRRNAVTSATANLVLAIVAKMFRRAQKLILVRKLHPVETRPQALPVTPIPKSQVCALMTLLVAMTTPVTVPPVGMPKTLRLGDKHAFM
jgi:hypothetical protein